MHNTASTSGRGRKLSPRNDRYEEQRFVSTEDSINPLTRDDSTMDMQA